MKEITKEVKKEIIDTLTVYQAADGTEFASREECKKYEESAVGVLLVKMEKFSIGEVPCDIDENDGSQYKAVVPESQEDIDVLNHLYFMHGGKPYAGREVSPKFTGSDMHRPALVGRRLYGDTVEWVWFYKLDDFIKEVTKDKFIITERP